MTTYELETGTVGFELLNETAHHITYGGINKDKAIWYRYYDDKGVRQFSSIKLQDGFIPLSLFSQLKEEDVKGIMPYQEEEDIDEPEPSTTSKIIILKSYYDFINECYDLDTAEESIHSLAQHLGLNAVNALQDPNDKDCTTELCTMEEWQEAQSKVKQYFVVFKAKE